jgi:glycosyltransferase involved in cell wall biosynthesis
LKIGIIHGFVGGGGGTEKTLLTLIEALVEKNHTVNLYTISKPSIQISGARVHSMLPFRLPIFGLYQRYLESRLIEKANNDDIVFQASGGLVLPTRLDQQIIIYCHHDFQNETNKTVTKYTGIWSWYYKPYYKLSQKFVNQITNKNIHLIANSKYIHDSLQKKFGKDSTIIYPPVELSEFSQSVSKKNKVITISRYSQEKNLEFAIDVMKDLNVNYTMIGNTKTHTNEIYYEQLIKKISELKNKTIVLLKNISRKKTVNELLESKIYLHTSPETFGISVIESMASGCVPIVPNNSAHMETIPIEELRFEQDNIKDAQDKIQKALLGNYDKHVEFLKESSKKYDKASFKKKIIDYIELHK